MRMAKRQIARRVGLEKCSIPCKESIYITGYNISRLYVESSVRKELTTRK